MALLKVSDVKREIEIFPYGYIDSLIVGLLNGHKKEEVYNILITSLDKNCKNIGGTKK